MSKWLDMYNKGVITHRELFYQLLRLDDDKEVHEIVNGISTDLRGMLKEYVTNYNDSWLTFSPGAYVGNAERYEKPANKNTQLYVRLLLS